MRSLIGPSALLVALTIAEPAAAQSDAAASALFEEGRAAMQAGDLDTACKKFRASDALSPAPGAKLNLANCEEQRGNVASAWERYNAALEGLKRGDRRREVAEQRVSALASRVPQLTVTLAEGAPPGTVVKIGDMVLPRASFGTSLPLDPGRHTVIVSAQDRATRSFEVTMEEGANERLEVAPGDAVEGATPVPVTPEASGDAQAQDRGGWMDQRTLGYVAGGVGAAGVDEGVVSGVMALGKKSTRDENCDSNKLCNQEGLDANDAYGTLGTVANVGWVVGALGIGAGAYLIFTSDSGEQTALGTAIGPKRASVSLSRTW